MRYTGSRTVIFGLIGLFVGTNIGAYYATKEILINKAINGEEVVFEEPVNNEYKTAITKTFEKIGSVLYFGDDIAVNRFELGKYNDIIDESKQGITDHTTAE